MIPTCIRAPRSIQGSTDDVTRQTRSIVQIYTDWANHYLERARSRRRAGASGGGLARDCADGLLLADVLEGVTGQKVPRAHRKPRNPQQMVHMLHTRRRPSAVFGRTYGQESYLYPSLNWSCDNDPKTYGTKCIFVYTM
ncbi:unnamed protein product, partial [Iphiclides podalirius]